MSRAIPSCIDCGDRDVVGHECDPTTVDRYQRQVGEAALALRRELPPEIAGLMATLRDGTDAQQAAIATVATMAQRARYERDRALRTVGIKIEAMRRMGATIGGLHENIIALEHAIRLRDAKIRALKRGEPVDLSDIEPPPPLDLDERGHPLGRIMGALRSCIDAHGPITKEWLRSAAKRVIAELRVHNRFAGHGSEDAATIAAEDRAS